MISLGSALLGHLLLVQAAGSMPSVRSAGICAMVEKRMELARSAPSPKLLIIGGSGVSNGISAGSMSESLGVPVQNFGLQAGTGTGFMLDRAKSVLRKGDIAMLAFEYHLYNTKRPSDVALDVAMNCGRDFLARQPLQSRIRDALSLPYSALFSRLRYAIMGNPHNEPAITAHGDIIFQSPRSHMGNSDIERIRRYKPMEIALNPDSPDVNEIRKFIGWAKQADVIVLATWPNTLAFSEYNKAEGFKAIERFYTELGVPMIGRPADAMVGIGLLDDTQYHLNAAGVATRTVKLSAALAGRPDVTEKLRSPEH
ncbi:hypothetical protein [Iodidimonas sp. SYSU 1G8]|uniref:hypothetical protein n=1 Tax=Iodidimonas sp. SYSU 1G8 TaxID=3133967 RepID=UPI0031FE70AC